MSEMTSIRWPADEFEAVEAWRGARRPLLPRGEAIRALVRKGLEAYQRENGAKERKKQ